MCGIAGVIALDGLDPQRLVQMTHLVTHRGPDGYGFGYFGLGPEHHAEIILNDDHPPAQAAQVGLGHRRLAILDLSPLGSQPMQTRDGALTIVFNGEIYNYVELREELKALGYKFESATDTEVLLYAYREWGSGCLPRLNGMWSFAIWDRIHQKLFCARDRLGIKPFYYYRDAKRFLFASEIKQISHYPDVPRRANPAPVLEYLESGIIDHCEETLFEEIRELRGGHYLTLDLASGGIEPKVERYWALRVEPNQDLFEGAACEEFRAMFVDAVRLRMRSDVPVGSCLSGGLDSSSIVSVAQSLMPHANFHTFSACFEQPELDERDYIREAVAAAQVKAHFVFPKGEAFTASLDRLLWHQDEPVAGSSVFAQHAVMAEARRENIPVLLDGQGGDETLCGYRKFRYFYLWHLLKKNPARFISEAASHLYRGDLMPQQWSDATRYLPGLLQRNRSVVARVGGNGFNYGNQHAAVDIGAGDTLAARQKDDLLRYSLPVLLRYEDRNSMAHSIETRLPFLDYRLVEFLVNCPDSMKLRGGWSKWILRKTMAGVVPDKIRLRKRKLGFDTPESQWMRTHLRGLFEDVFANGRVTMSPYLDPSKLRAEFRRFCDRGRGALSASGLLRPLTLELWARVHAVTA